MKRFKKVYIEITNICNLDCSFCPKTKRKLESMDEAHFVKILSEIKGYTDYVYFHLMGEPFLNPNLARFLELCHEANLKVNITTNGTLLSQVKSVLLSAPALRQVNISLSSFEANAITKPLETYLTEVTDFVTEAADTSDIICSIRLWNMDSESLKGSNQFNREILQFLETHMNMSENTLLEMLEKKPSAKLRERIYINMAEKFEWPDLEKESMGQAVFCYGLRDQMGILVDGTVVPCCLDSDGNIDLGNIFRTPLETILNSERATALFDGFSRRVAVEPLCQKCGYAKRY